MLFSRYTWRQLHDLGNLEWDVRIPSSTQELAKLTLYSFFLESSHEMSRYNISEHPKTKYYLIGLTDASLMFHAYQIYLVSVLHDFDITRVQLLASSAKTNKTHDRTAPFYELTGVVEVLIEIRKLVNYFISKNFHIPPENIRVLTDSECSLIWIRVIKSRFRIGVQTLITKVSLILHDLGLCPFKNINYINQHQFEFPVDNLTKLHAKENPKRIEARHKKLRSCDWLGNKHDLLKVIDQPWSPLHETKKYILEAEPLPDFVSHLEGGIEELKTTSNDGSNLLTFINEITEFSDNSPEDFLMPEKDISLYSNSDPENIILNIQEKSDFMNQIIEVHKRLKKVGRHPLGRNGVYYIFGLVKFAAYKWLNKIKSRKNKYDKKQILPTSHSNSTAKNEIFSIINKDHYTQQSKELITSLLIYWTNLYLKLNLEASSTIPKNISLKDYLFWGKTVIHSTIHSTHTWERIRNFKNFIISFNHIQLHLILTRPQKVIEVGNIVEKGRGLLFPLYVKDEFSLQILESLHDLYC